MADHSKPLTTSTYANFVSELDARFDDLAVGLDPAYTTATNVPTNTVRFSSASAKWQKWSGSTWADLAATYAISITGNAGTVTNGVVTTGSYSDPTWVASLAGSKISGNIAGNAGSATVLATARNINGVSFNGSAAISVNLNNNVTFSNAGSGAASGVTFSGGSAVTVSHNTIGAAPLTGTGTSGTWPISVSGNAGSATTAGAATTITGVAQAFGLATSAQNTALASKVGPEVTAQGGGGAVWSMHRPGAYGLNMGLDSDNVFRIGGWSADANRLQMDMSGNLTMNGNVTAYSDERLKENWRDLPADFIERLARVKMGVYDRKDTGETQVGVGAQSLRSEALTEAVHEGADGKLSVAYGNAALASCVALAREVMKLKKIMGERI